MKGDFPYYGANGLVDHVNNYLFDGSYVLLAEDGGYFDDPVRGVAYEASGKFWVNNHAHILEPLGGISSRFLRHQLNETDWMPVVGGTTRLKLTQGGLQRKRVLVPPLSEQRRIVAKIDSLTGKSQRAREHLNQIPRLVEKYKRAVLAAAFRGELTREWRSTSGATIDDWQAAPLGTVARVGTGATPKRGTSRYYDGGTVPWITSSAVNLPLITEPTEFITEAALRETNCKVYPAGTLVVAMYGEGKTRGTTAVLGIAAATNQALAAIVVNDDGPIHLRYLFWYLRGRYAELREEAAGGVQPNLNLGIIKNLPVPLPSADEQTETVRVLEHEFAATDRLLTEAVSARKLLDRLDQSVLAKAFRGELVPQDPNDEPASVLLARIRAERAGPPKAKRGRKAMAE